MYETIIKPQNDSSEIDELQDWVWPKSDTGTWGDDEHCLRGDWLQHHSEKWFEHVKQFRVCIQAGGNCGMYPRLLAEKFETVYTFEPAPIPFHCLVNNNQINNVIKLQIALGAKASQVAINYVPSHSGCSDINEDVEGTIPMMPLDAFNFPNVDLLALDTEGYEAHILEGAVITINKWKPVIICELGNDAKKKEWFEKLGYKIIDESGADSILLPE